MKAKLLTGLALGAALLGAPAIANAQAIGVQVFDNGLPIGSIALTPGGVVSGVFSDAAFTSVIVSATGSPATPFPSFGTTTTNISTNFDPAGGPHTLTIISTQIGVTPTGASEDFSNAFTTNNLVGASGVASVNFANFVDAADLPFNAIQGIGATAFLGSIGATSVNGTGNGFIGPFFSETMIMTADFTGGISQIQTTDQITGVPEPGTWAMMLLGFAGLAFAFHKRRKSAQLPALA
jgi:hypothetical protein